MKYNFFTSFQYTLLYFNICYSVVERHKKTKMINIDQNKKNSLNLFYHSIGDWNQVITNVILSIEGNFIK